MARKYSQTASTNEIKDWIRIDSTGTAGSDFLIVIDFESGGTSSKACVDVQFTAEEDLSTACPIQHHILNDIECSTASTLHIPITGIRMATFGHKEGTITLRVVQHMR